MRPGPPPARGGLTHLPPPLPKPPQTSPRPAPGRRFHKDECHRNDFADCVEATEPKFARFMRKHGKIAVLKDDEVERLERADQGSGGRSRQEVMASMYGRADPKPLAPSYTAEEVLKMQAAERARLERQEQLYLDPGRQEWQELAAAAPRNFGADCGAYQWQQNQGEVTVFVRLKPKAVRGEVEVAYTEDALRVLVDGEAVLEGALYQPVVPAESGWFISNDILELTLRKRYRRGYGYAPGKSNADTFWRGVLADAPEALPLGPGAAPSAYYSSEWRVSAEDALADRADRLKLRAARQRGRRAVEPPPACVPCVEAPGA